MLNGSVVFRDDSDRSEDVIVKVTPQQKELFLQLATERKIELEDLIMKLLESDWEKLMIEWADELLEPLKQD